MSADCVLGGYTVGVCDAGARGRGGCGGCGGRVRAFVVCEDLVRTCVCGWFYNRGDDRPRIGRQRKTGCWRGLAVQVRRAVCASGW